MKRIEIINPTRTIDKLTKALAEGDKRTVNYEFTVLKRELQKQKRSAQYYEKTYSDTRSAAASAQLKSINANLDYINQAQKMANEYIRNPKNIRLNKTVANLNLIDLKYKQLRQEAQTYKTTIINIRATEKVEVLFTRLFLENENYNSERILSIAEEIKNILPFYDFEQVIRKTFDRAEHYDSGDEHAYIINEAIKGSLADTISSMKNNISSDDYEKLEDYYSEILNIMEAN